MDRTTAGFLNDVVVVTTLRSRQSRFEGAAIPDAK